MEHKRMFDTEQVTLFFLIIISIVLLLVFNNNLQTSKFVAIIVLIISIINVYKSRKNWGLFIIFGFIFYSNYSICMSDYLGDVNNYLTSLKNDSSAIVAINILLVFNCLLSLSFFFKSRKETINNAMDSFCEHNPSNSVICYGLIIVLVFVYFFGFTKPDIIGERGKPSSYYEYSLILFIFAYYYSKTKLERCLLSICIVAFALQNIMYGGRATAIQLLICFFLIFFAKKISIVKAIPFILIGLVVFTAVGNLRTQFNLNFSSLTGTFSVLTVNYFVNDTAYSAFFTSQTFILTAAISSFDIRLKLFMNFLLSMILGGSNVPNSNLPSYTHRFYTHYYGGVLPYYGYFYIGFIGVVLFALLVCFYNRTLVIHDNENNGLKKCLAVYIISTVPRWYLYSPSPLLRGVFLLIVLYYLAFYFNKLCERRYTHISLER